MVTIKVHGLRGWVFQSSSACYHARFGAKALPNRAFWTVRTENGQLVKPVVTKSVEEEWRSELGNRLYRVLGSQYSYSRIWGSLDLKTIRRERARPKDCRAQYASKWLHI